MENSLQPQVTIVVVPRERFSYTKESLESVYNYTTIPFKLIYIDGNSPKEVCQYLQKKAEEKQFQLIRTDYYLSPNHARNLGLAQVDTEYVVFLDNDVVVSSGWLNHLVKCAEETAAAVVGPLMCQNEPLHEIVHFAGGESHVWTDQTGRRRLREKMYRQGQRVVDVRPQLQRQQTELAEFHCVLVRTKIFERIGYLDEAFFNTKEHLDFCMIVREVGETVYFEPDSLVTYVPGPPLKLSDLHYYMLRWSNGWTVASLQRMQEKWNVVEDGYFQNKYKKLGWRRHMTIIEPVVRRLTLGLNSKLLCRILAWIEHPVNNYLTTRYAQKQQQRQHLHSSKLTASLNSNSISL
ncbi:MAG: glycosyltransferase [Richelia sp. RM2_1_2]|nr:glycosyltransferase [Richelia sp. SM1_7_0]NJN06512.1 glycosyltransferase [Richelia sp. RM1_1_1]NJO26277.1 glycosyltransferase [Richelia sp. SL_2_1]NJO58972.1 glycosyltransferase [Richelia sp. RM2_1_2]